MALKDRARTIRGTVEPAQISRILGLGDGPKILCLWHLDNDPSLHLYSDGLRCFGACKENYTVIDLVMEFYGIGLQEAVEWIEHEVEVPDVVIEPRAPEELDKVFWASAELLVIGLVRPFLLHPDDEIYQKMHKACWQAYAWWDRLVVRSKARGEYPSRTLQLGMKQIRRHLKEARYA